MSLEEQRKELSKMIESAKDFNQKVKAAIEPVEVEIGFWFKYQDRVFVFKGLKNDKPEFIEMITNLTGEDK